VVERLGIGLIVAIVLVYFSTRNWRTLLNLVLVVIVFEGVLRKWLLPQASDLTYFAKDIVFMGALAKYYLSSSRERTPDNFRKDPIVFLLIISFIWCTASAFRLDAFEVGLIGIKGYLMYVPFLFLSYYLYKSEKELNSFLNWYLLLTIPVGLLGMVQFYSDPTAPINAYGNVDPTMRATFGADGIVRARISSTFAFLDLYAVYLIVCFGLLLPLILHSTSLRWRIALTLALLVVTANCLMTGSRSCVLACLLFVVGFVATKVLFQTDGLKQVVTKMAVPGVLIAICILLVFGDSVRAFGSRFESGQDEMSGRVIRLIADPIDYLDDTPLWGIGTGSTQGASAALLRVLGLPSDNRISVYVEEEPERILLEIGVVGFLLWYGLRVLILFKLWQLYRLLKSPFLKDLALIAFLIHLIQLPDQLVTHNVFAVFYWYMASFIYMLPALDQQRNDYKPVAWNAHYGKSLYIIGSSDS
jgi:hypothetical protein